MRLDDLYDVGAQDGPQHVSDRVVTVPNLLSLLRLLALPWVYLWIVDGRPVAALVLLGVLGATDWVDGFVARRFDQVSRLGQLMDPVSDRVLIVVVVVAVVVGGVLPWWAVAPVLLRDVAVALVGLPMLLRGGAELPPVTRVGKTATFQLMTAFPFVLLGEALSGTPGDAARWFGWFALACGTVLYWVAAVDYARGLRRGASRPAD